jgi:hypothetical protein
MSAPSATISADYLIKRVTISIQIVSLPPGDVPEWVRREWVGLTFPVISRNEKPVIDLFVDFLKRRNADYPAGWRVKWDIAMNKLGDKSPAAREWWEKNVSPTALTFTDGCCRVIHD